MEFIFSQVCVILAMLFLALTYISKDKNRILVFCVISSIMYATQYLLLDAYTGMIVNMISVVRAIWFFINNKVKKENSLYSLILLEMLFLASSIITWNGFISIFPLIACLLFTYSIWQKNIKLYKWIALPVSFLWIIYNVLVGSVFGYISEGILLLVEIIGVITYYNK